MDEKADAGQGHEEERRHFHLEVEPPLYIHAINRRRRYTYTAPFHIIAMTTLLFRCCLAAIFFLKGQARVWKTPVRGHGGWCTGDPSGSSLIPIFVVVIPCMTAAWACSRPTSHHEIGLLSRGQESSCISSKYKILGKRSENNLGRC